MTFDYNGKSLELDTYTFASKGELVAEVSTWAKTDLIYWGHIESYCGELYSPADLLADVDEAWFEEGSTSEVYRHSEKN